MLRLSKIGNHGDVTKEPVEKLIQVEPGDLIILGNSGLFDNVDEIYLKACVKPFLRNPETVIPDLLAEIIAKFG